MTVDIKSIFETDIRFGVLYCRLCFRTSKETRLVNPDCFRQFARVIDKKFCDSEYFGLMPRVCYMCEANTKMALRMLMACINADRAHQLFSAIEEHLDSGHPLDTEMTNILRDCNEHIESLRSQTLYKFTEVLTVDVNHVQFGNLQQQSKVTLEHQQPASTVSTRKNSQSLPPWQPNFETVILDDDDDDIIIQTTPQQTLQPKAVPSQAIPSQTLLLQSPENVDHPFTDDIKCGLRPKVPETVSMDTFLSKPADNQAAIMPTDNKVIVRPKANSEYCILHEIVSLKNGCSMYVPTLSCQIRQGRLKYLKKFPKSLQMVPPGKIVLDHAVPKNITKATEQQKPIMISGVTTLSAEAEALLGNETETGDADEVNQILRSALSKMSSKRTVQENSCNKKMRSEVNMVSCDSDNSDDAPLAVISNVKTVVEKETVKADARGKAVVGMSFFSSGVDKSAERSVPVPVNTGRVDWEDKIPMDVISLVEPNAQMLILPD